MIATICPDRETLLRYSLGMLPDQQREALDAHLDSCPDCQAMLATFDDADDTAIGRLRMPLSGESVLGEPQLQEALAAAMAMPADMPSAADMPRMLGEYQVIEELGRGGMGRVYKALHTRLDRVVAVKVLPRGRAGDENAANRFAREMRAVGRLVHPNIVQAYDAREIDGTAVLIMELVDGLDLAEVVRRAGAGVPALAGEDRSPAPPKAGTPAPSGIPVPDACELVRQTALALQCAHEHGLVHRDIKPSNIMLARSGEVKLLDLGLARFFAESGADVSSASHVEEMTGTGQAMGTADYMAPEQASDSRTVDIRADIYSLGCTLYKLLTGRAPFSGPEYRTTLDKMNAHVHQPVPPVRQIVPEVPDALAAVLDRMLAKDPSARFATPAEVAQAVAPFCAGSDLVTLLKEAESRQGQQGLQGQQDEGGDSLPSPSGRGAGGEGVAVASQSAAQSSSGWKRLAGQLAVLLLVGSLGIALGILIRIHKDGQTTTVGFPDGSNARVGADGTIDVNVPGKAAAPAAISPLSPGEGQGVRAVNPAADLKALQGIWNVVAVEKGKQAKGEISKILEYGDWLEPEYLYRLDFRQGNSLPGYPDTSLAYFLDPRRVWPGPHDHDERFLYYRIDPTAAPKTMDILSFVIENETHKDNLRAVAVYELHGDHLKIAMRRYSSSVTSDQRPKRFDVEPDSETIVLHLDRYRPAADDIAIQGTWEVAKEINDGRETSANGLSGRSFEFADYYFKSTVPSRGKDDQERYAKWVIDSAKDPKAISILSYDWEHTEAGRPTPLAVDYHGIYKLDGDRLTIAYRVNRPSPEKFESAPGSGVKLLVLHKIDPNLPVVRVSQPVVCNVCDYEEYSGRINNDDAPASIAFQVAAEFKAANKRTIVKEGDVLGEMVPFDDPTLRKAVEAVRIAESKLADIPASPPPLPPTGAKRKADAEAELKAAKEELDRAKRKAPRVKVLAPMAGTFSRTYSGMGFRGGFSGSSEYVQLSIEPSDAAFVSFDMPEKTVLAHRRMTDRKPYWELWQPVLCGLADDKGFPYRGKVVSTSGVIDPKTGTQRWVAMLPNKERLFVDGMSVRLRLVTSEPHKVMLITRGDLYQEGDPPKLFVNVLSERNILQKREVKLGSSYDNYLAVTEGLNANDWIAPLTGQSRAVAGATVRPDKYTLLPPPWASQNILPPAPPPTVSVVHPVLRQVTEYYHSTAQVVPSKSAEIRARVTGNLIKVHVKLGMSVKKGDILFEIDPRLYQAEVDQAASGMKQAKIRLDARTEDLKREEKLEKGAVSQAELDQTKSQRAEAEAALQTAEAALKSAQLRLDFTRVAAPFAGKIGGAVPDEGNLATADTTVLAAISATDPVHLTFPISEEVLANIRRQPSTRPTGEGDPALSLPVQCGLANVKNFDFQAKMDSVENRVRTGGNVMCRAVLANDKGIFVPGMDVNVRVPTGAHERLVVPNSALEKDGDTNNVVDVVNKQNVVEFRNVRAGDLLDDGLRVVSDRYGFVGVKPEDWVIAPLREQVERAKLQPGMTVKPEELAAPPHAAQ